MNRARVFAMLVAVALLLAALMVVLRPGRATESAAVRLLPARPVTPGPAESLAWWSPVHGEPLGLAVDGGDVAVTALDEVRLLDAEHGRIRWKVAFPGVRRHRPAVGAGRVAATSETELLLLDRADGTPIAATPFAGPGPAGIIPNAGGAIVVAGSRTGEILAVDAATGGARWSAVYPGAVTVAPRGDAGIVVASWRTEGGATLRALDAVTGLPVWEESLGEVNGPPALAAGAVLVTDGEGIHSATARALDLRDGRERWRVPLAGWWDHELEAAVDGDTAYLLDGMGTVVAIDPATGAVRWRRETGRPLVDGRVVLTGRSVVFASYDDELLVLDRATGAVRAVEAQRGVPVDVAAAGDRLVLALRLGAPSRVEARPEP